MADVMEQSMSVDSPKEGKARRKVTPAPAFEEDIVDGISIRAFNAPESVKAYVSAHASQQAVLREKRKREQHEKALRLQKQHMERFHHQQRIQQAEDEKARKRIRRIEDRKYPESEFITEHGIDSMVPSPTFERARAKSDSDSDYEPSVAKKRRRTSHSHRSSRRPQSQQYSGSSSSDDGAMCRTPAKQSKSPGHARHPAHAHSGPLAGRAQVSPSMPMQQQLHAGQRPPAEGYTHMSREAIEQYQRAVMAQSTAGAKTGDPRQGPPAAPTPTVAAPDSTSQGPPPLRSSSQFAIHHTKLFDKPYPLPEEEIHWPIIHVSIANRIKQHKDGGCEKQFESILDTLPTYLPRPSFITGSGAPTATTASNPQQTSPSSHGSSTTMHATTLTPFTVDHHGPPATAPALPNAGDAPASSPRPGASTVSPTTPPASGLQPGARTSQGADAKADGSKASAGTSQLRERLEKPPVAARSHSPIPTLASRPTTVTAITSKPPAGSSNTLMSVDHKSLVLIEKKPMVGIKTASGIHYIEVTVTQPTNPQSGKVLVRPTNPLSAEHLAAISNPTPSAGSVSPGTTSPVMALKCSSGTAVTPTLHINAMVTDSSAAGSASSLVIPVAPAAASHSAPTAAAPASSKDSKAAAASPVNTSAALPASVAATTTSSPSSSPPAPSAAVIAAATGGDGAAEKKPDNPASTRPLSQSSSGKDTTDKAKTPSPVPANTDAAAPVDKPAVSPSTAKESSSLASTSLPPPPGSAVADSSQAAADPGKSPAKDKNNVEQKVPTTASDDAVAPAESTKDAVTGSTSTSTSSAEAT